MDFEYEEPEKPKSRQDNFNIDDVVEFDESPEQVNHLLETDKIQNQINSYYRAVEQNIEDCILEPAPKYVIARLMPHFEIYGSIAHPRPKGRGITNVWTRYGHVVAVGDNLKDEFDPGDLIAFNHNYGLKFYGKYNPLSVSDDDFDWDDEVRFLRYLEVFGKVSFDLEGKTVTYQDPGGDLTRRAKVLSESPMYRDNVLAEDQDSGESFWLPTRWIEGEG